MSHAIFLLPTLCKSSALSDNFCRLLYRPPIWKLHSYSWIIHLQYKPHLLHYTNKTNFSSRLRTKRRTLKLSFLLVLSSGFLLTFKFNNGLLWIASKGSFFRTQAYLMTPSFRPKLCDECKLEFSSMGRLVCSEVYTYYLAWVIEVTLYRSTTNRLDPHK